jgi:hypothetical protein
MCYRNNSTNQTVISLVTTFPDSRDPKVQERGLQELTTGLYQNNLLQPLTQFLEDQS